MLMRLLSVPWMRSDVDEMCWENDIIEEIKEEMCMENQKDMIKNIEMICDRFTLKEYVFEIDEKNILEGWNMIYESIRDIGIIKSKMFDRDLIVRVSEYEGNNIISYKISVNLSNIEWNTLLKSCKKHKYQLLVKKDKDVMYFTKIGA